MVNSTHQLIRVRYDLADRELARRLRNPYEQHRTLWRLFPDAPQRAFLFRQSSDPALQRRGIGEFLLLADRPPKTDHPFKLETRRYQPALEVDDRLHFSLRAEVLASGAPRPPDSTSSPARKRGERFDPLWRALQQVPSEQRAALRRLWLYGDSDPSGVTIPARLLSDWLAPKLARLGLALDLEQSRSEGYDTVTLTGAERKISYSYADFQGLVRVLDPALAMQAALQGVGHGKAFGCGLLLLRRASSD